MSIPYLPGWWDEISKNATGLVSQLPQFIQPDRVASKKLEQMLQQNPMLAEQMSNMDAGTRQLLEQSIGFRKQAPISAMPVGAERQMREMTQGILGEVMKDPVKRQDYIKKVTGARTDTDIKKEQQELTTGQQQIDINAMNAELLSGKVKDFKRTQASVDAALAKYPDLSGVNYKTIVRDLIRTGKPVDPALITASIQDEGAKALLDLGIKSELMSLENEYAMRLRTAKDPNTSALLLRTLTEQANQIETTQQRLMMQKQAAEKSLVDDTAFKLASITAANDKDPAKRKAAQAIVDAKMAPIQEIDKAIATYMQAGLDIQQRTEKYGEMIGLPKLDKKPETPQERMARLRKAAGM